MTKEPSQINECSYKWLNLMNNGELLYKSDGEKGV
jgi:hypothetical protein